MSPERRYVEEFAVEAEALGWPRAYGRLLGYLLICDPPSQSSSELADALGMSKGSVSTATRMLEKAGLLRRVPRPGRRGTSFEMTPDAMVKAADSGPRFTAFRQLLDRGLALLGDDRSARARRLRRTRDFYAFCERELPLLVVRFRAEYGPDDGESPEEDD